MLQDSKFCPLVCRNTVSCRSHFLINQVFIPSQLPEVCLPCQTQMFKSSSVSCHFSEHGFLPPYSFAVLLSGALSLFFFSPMYLKRLLFPLIPSALFSTVSNFADLISFLLAPTVYCLHFHSVLAACFWQAILKSNWMFLVLKFLSRRNTSWLGFRHCITFPPTLIL